MKKMLSIEDAGLGYANKEFSYLEIAPAVIEWRK